MENRERLTYETTTLIPASKKRVWGIIKDFSKLPLLTGLAVEGSLELAGDDSAEGDAVIGGVAYKMRCKPFDMELAARDRKIGFRLAETREGCKVYAVSISRTEETLEDVKSFILIFLANLSAEAERSRKADAAAAAAERESVAKQAMAEKVREVMEEPAPAAREQEPPREKKRLSRLSIGLAAAAVVLLCLAVLGFMRLKERREFVMQPADAREITLSAADSISVGMDEGEVAYILGGFGTERPDGSVVYGAESGAKVLVRFSESGTVAEVRCVLPENAAVANNDDKIDPAADVSAVSDIKSAENVIGIPASGFIKTADSLTVAFGFFDPYASFAEAWQPEYALTIAAESASLRRLWDYDSSLPYIVPQLSGTPLAYQYTSQNELVQDMYAYLSSLQLLGGYSLGDIENILGGTLVQYENFANMSLMELSVHSPIATMEVVAEDGSVSEQAAYRITVSLNERQFRSGTYANLRIFEKPGMLKGAPTARVTRGMSMQEVQQLMGVLPTAFFYEGESIYLCYGRYIETDVLEEQFEFILRINVAENVVTNIYDNIAVAAEQDALAGNA